MKVISHAECEKQQQQRDDIIIVGNIEGVFV